MPRRILAVLLLGSVLAGPAWAQGPAAPRVDRNVVYGMVSGLALLADVHRPAQPNGIAIIAIHGTGWYQAMRYDAIPLKERREVVEHAARFAAAGYTVFVINHRSAPRFRFPDPVDDAQRAVRFIRAHKADYGLTSDRVGAWGSSSGGHLVEMLGTLDGAGRADDLDAVNRQSAKVDAVVALFAPSDLPTAYPATSRPGTYSALMGFAYQDPALPGGARPDDVEIVAYRAASPVTHVNAGDAPMLLFHGDLDEIAPIQQSELMEATLKKAGVEVRFTRVPGGKHGANFQFPAGDARAPDEIGAAIAWFDAHLKRAASPEPVAVTIPAADGGTIRGDVYGAGPRAVLLLHGGRFDRTGWTPQARVLAQAGFRVLAIDFRAAVESRAGRETPCLYDAGCLAKDALEAVRYLRRTGATSVAIVGGSLGGGAAAQAAIDATPGEIDRIVLLAHMTVDAPERIRVPALFILARDDANAGGPRLPGIRAQYEKVNGPKELVLLDGSAHAQFLFDSPQGDETMRAILRFLGAT